MHAYNWYSSSKVGGGTVGTSHRWMTDIDILLPQAGTYVPFFVHNDSDSALEPIACILLLLQAPLPDMKNNRSCLHGCAHPIQRRSFVRPMYSYGGQTSQ